jgi:hypothetical protein
MMDLECVFNGDPKVFEQVVSQLTPERRKRIEATISAIYSLAESRRRDKFILGKHLTDMVEVCAEQSVALAQLLPKAFHPSYFYRALRVYQRFRNFESVLGLIHVGVQDYVANHAYSPDVMREIILIAREGREVTSDALQQDILKRLKVKAKPLADGVDEIADDESLADLSDAAAVEGDVEEDTDDPLPDDDDTDPWDVDDDDDEDDNGGVIAGHVASATGRPNGKPPMRLETVDIADRREKLITNATHELSGAIRSIDDFCETYAVMRGAWWNHFKKGADLLLDGLREWQKADIKQR